MKHIDTTCAEEKQARKKFAEVHTGETVVAEEGIEKVVRDLLDLRHKMDEDALKASTMKASIMAYMKNADTLKGKDGTVLAKWVAGNINRDVDYKGILMKYAVSQEDVDAFTKERRGSRVFSIEEV